MKKLMLILAAVLVACAACCKIENPTGIELGLYSASTPDGDLYTEFLGENTHKLYFNGQAGNMGYYATDGDKITFAGVVEIECRRAEHFGQTLVYSFSSSSPGTITSRTSFKVEGRINGKNGEAVVCEFKKR